MQCVSAEGSPLPLSLGKEGAQLGPRGGTSQQGAGVWSGPKQRGCGEGKHALSLRFFQPLGVSFHCPDPTRGQDASLPEHGAGRGMAGVGREMANGI